MSCVLFALAIRALRVCLCPAVHEQSVIKIPNLRLRPTSDGWERLICTNSVNSRGVKLIKAQWVNIAVPDVGIRKRRLSATG